VDIAQFQAYGYFILIAILVLALYGYIYHLYTVRKDSDGHDYEEYSNMALNDDITDTPVSELSKENKK